MNRETQKAFLAGVGRFVRKLIGELEPRIKAIEGLGDSLRADITKAIADIPVPRDGESIKPEDVRPMLTDMVKAEVDKIERPKDGESVPIEAVQRMVDEAVGRIDKPKDGKDGATAEEVRELVRAAVADIPPAKDGKSVDADELADALMPRLADRIQSAIDKAVLDVERRAQGVLERAVANIPKPKDGEDGFGLDDLVIEDDGDGTLTLRFIRGDLVREKAIRYPRGDRGVFRDGGSYRKGDGVTFNGSWWIAQNDEPQGKPGASEDWRLAVKAGREGANAYQIALRNGFKGSEKEWVERGCLPTTRVVKIGPDKDED